MTTQEKIADLVVPKLGGRKIDVVGFIDALLEFVSDDREIRCSFTDAALRFETGNHESCDVKLQGSRGKLRMLCARISPRCQRWTPYT